MPRDRLIRFEALREVGKPGLLSIYDEEKNLVRIDDQLVQALPKNVQDQLMFTTIPLTALSRDGQRFEPYYNQ